MGHTPYGYRIEDGKAVVDEKTSEQVKELFSGYLAGLSLKEAAKKAGIPRKDRLLLGTLFLNHVSKMNGNLKAIEKTSSNQQRYKKTIDKF